MKIGRVVPRLAGACVLLASVSFGSWAQDGPLTVGPNINMVSGTDWPEGDPFLRQQNEPSLAFSSRNKLHLLAGANDYRTVDVPGDFEAGATGDSWLSYFWSTNGGGTWKSTLIPCYPQDTTSDCSNNPLQGYAAGADPVVRAGANGMFYYAGIAFERTENPGSLIFVSRFIDLNNDEGGDPIRYIDTVQVDVDVTGDRFLDKVWVAVDVPRSGAATKTFTVNQRSGPPVEQKVSCGNIYVAYAALTGDGATLRSEIMMAVSSDCGDTWTKQPISEPDTLNQGANIAISPMDGNVHVGWRRFDTVEAFLGTPAVSCAKPISDWRRRRRSRVAVDWPIDNVDLGDERLTREQALDLLGQPGLLPSVRLAQFLVAAKLNLVSGGGQATDTFDPAEWTRTLSGLIDETDDFFRDKPLRAVDAGFFSDPRTLFFPSGLNFRERRAARELRIAIRDIYLGSEDCVATVGTDPITTGATNAMVATSSTDGASWTPPVTVAEIRTFDQGGTNFSFRTTAYPTLAVDKAGRVYMAYAARGFATVRPDEVEGDARIVLSVSSDGGANWQAPYAIDDDPEKPGHQFKPSLLFAGGRLVVVFYDLRADVSGLFERFVYDVPEPDRLRHTLDVRAATASVLAGPLMPQFTLYDISDRRDSQQTSRYAFVATGNGVPVDTVQLQYMVPNLPTHAGGTQPFIGDYVDVSTKTILKEGNGWRFATEPGDVDVYQAVWTDNRDITPPPDGDWTQYQPLNLDSGGGGSVSVFDGSPIPACEPGVTSQFTGTRNQNIYTAALSEGLIVAAPGSNRPLGTAEGSTELLERAYVVFVQNVTAFERDFRLTAIPPVPGTASFEQFADKSSVDVTVPPFSSTVETVYATSPDPNAPVAVLVQELDALGAPLAGGLASTVLLNADPTAPAPSDTSLLSAETHNPTVLNPTVLNPTVLNPTVLNPTVLNPTVFNPTVLNPTVFNPTVLNPTVFNPTVLNPTVFNPTVLNPTVFNPTVLNPTVLNPTVFNPTVFNPTILNPTVLNPTVFNPTVLNPTVLNPTVLNSAISDPAQQSAEVTFAVQNDGNATSSFDINLASSQGVDDGFSYQVLVYRLNKTPVADGCSLEEEAQQELIANVVDPGNLLDPSGGDGTTSFYIEPGDEVFVTVRVLPDTSQPNPGDPGTLDDNNLDLAIAVVPQAVNTVEAEMGETEPAGTATATAPVPPVEIDTQEIPDGDVDQPYSVALEASGGIGPLSWSLAMGGELLPGLSLSADGVISGTPTEPGSLVAPVRVTDGIQVAEAMFAATIAPPPLFITTTSLPDGTVDEAYPATALQSSGGFGEISWTLLSGSLPPGIVLASNGTLSGTPTADGFFDFIVEASDDFQSVDQSLTIGVASNDVVGGTGGSPFGLACPAGTVGIGLRGRSGQDIDRIELVCAEITGVSGGFPELGNEVSAGIAGTLGGTDFGDALICPPFTVFKGLRATERILGGGNVIVDQLGVTCIDSGGDLIFLPSTATLQGAADASGDVQQLNCPTDQFVTSVAGRNGTLLDQVGVSCAPVGGEFIAADIPPKFYGVAVANPGYLSRSGRVLEFSQSPREGIAFDFSESVGEILNRPFDWDVLDGELVLNYGALPGVRIQEALENTTATPEQIIQILAEPTFIGFVEATVRLTQTVYTLVVEGDLSRVNREDTQRTDYDPIPVASAPGGFIQLAPSFAASTAPGTLRDAATAPVIPLSADCSTEPCVPGSWGGWARYQPGNRWFDDSPYPTTHYGEVLDFVSGGQQTVSGDISNLSANWTVSNGSLEVVYDDGWTQTVTAVGVNGLEYGMFSEYRNVSSGERYASYDIWVKRDENFVSNVFSDAYLDNANDSYWNAEISLYLPGFLNPDGSRPLTPRFGWQMDEGGDPNTGFNWNTFFTGPNNDVLTLFLRPMEWEIEQPSRRVKIDRFLDTQAQSYDRFWYPLGSTTVDGDRQFYVMELERREAGLLFPARLNIQRERFDDRSEYDVIEVQEPVIEVDPPPGNCPQGTQPAEDINGIPSCALSGTYTSDLTLTQGNFYLLNGPVYIGNDNADAATLTIEAGVTVLANTSNALLSISRGSQINADGNPGNPITFTARADVEFGVPPGTAGLWGGVVLNGNGELNNCPGGIPGCSQLGEDGRNFGGDQNNSSSGVLRYVVIKYSGTTLAPGEEVNGLTLAAVGDDTTVDYVQVFNSADDGVEIFGGAVNIRHILIQGAGDDSLDWTFGWQGNAQFVHIEQFNADSTDKGIEADNFTGDENATPRSAPTIANLSILGRGDEAGIRLRRGTSLTLYNSEVLDSSACLQVQGTASTGLLSPPADPGPDVITFSGVKLDCVTATDTPSPEITAFLANAPSVTTDGSEPTPSPLPSGFVPNAIIGSDVDSWSGGWVFIPVQITSVNPQPAAAGFGQLLLVSGVNLPVGFPPYSAPDLSDRPVVYVTQSGVEYTGFSFKISETDNLLRLPTSGLVAGPALLQLGDPGSNERTPAFSIEISNTPAAPFLREARSSASFSAPAVSTFPIGGEIALLADNTDTSGVQAIFDVGGVETSAFLTNTTSQFDPTTGLLHSFNVPVSPPLGTPVGVTLTTTVNGFTSEPSNSLTLYACEPGNITIDGNNVINSTVGVAIAPDDEFFVRYDLAAATFGADLSVASLTVSGGASVSLVSGGLAGDTSAIFGVIASPNGQGPGAALRLAAGSLTLLGEPGDLLVFGQTFETITNAVSDSSPLYVTGPACQ